MLGGMFRHVTVGSGCVALLLWGDSLVSGSSERQFCLTSDHGNVFSTTLRSRFSFI